MPKAIVEGLSIGYEIIGDEGARPWAITPGGRYTMETAGVRELATALAELGNRVLIWDRPNTGTSEVCFTGEAESIMHADVLAVGTRHGPSGDRRRLCRVTRVDDRCLAPSDRSNRAGPMVDQRGPVRPHDARYGLLQRLHPRGVEWGHGGGGAVARMAGGPDQHPHESPEVPRPGFHRVSCHI